MRILHVLDHSAPLHSGYAFRTLAILREQRALGWETLQLTGPRQGDAASDAEVVDGVEFLRTPYRPGPLGRSAIGRPFDEMRATTARLAGLCARLRPDLVHAHSPVLDAWPAIRAGRAAGIPVVYEMRASWEDAAVDHGTTTEGSLRYRLSRAFESMALRRVDAVTTICEGLRGDIVSRGVDPRRVVVVPNGVDVERFAPVGERDAALAGSLGLDGAEVVGFCGSFYGYEGLELLVRAFPRVVARRPRARLLLVGGGPAEAAIRRAADEAGVADRTVFTGRVPHARIDAYYGLIDVLAFPRTANRLTELVTPLKPLEAMAQGLPVVASDVGGHRELIEHGATGLLHAAGDPEALADALAQVLDDAGLRARLAAAGRAFVERERSWRASVARYRPVYERLLAGGGPR